MNRLATATASSQAIPPSGQRKIVSINPLVM